jgi:hypothetical protein
MIAINATRRDRKVYRKEKLTNPGDPMNPKHSQPDQIVAPLLRDVPELTRLLAEVDEWLPK